MEKNKNVRFIDLNLKLKVRKKGLFNIGLIAVQTVRITQKRVAISMK